jgi:hypothetical protein
MESYQMVGAGEMKPAAVAAVYDRRHS